LLNIKQRDII